MAVNKTEMPRAFNSPVLQKMLSNNCGMMYNIRSDSRGAVELTLMGKKVATVLQNPDGRIGAFYIGNSDERRDQVIMLAKQQGAKLFFPSDATDGNNVYVIKPEKDYFFSVGRFPDECRRIKFSPLEPTYFEKNSGGGWVRNDVPFPNPFERM